MFHTKGSYQRLDLGVSAVEDSGKACCGDKGAGSLFSKGSGQVLCLLLEVLKADFHKLVVCQGTVKGADYSVGDTVVADHDYTVKALGLAS